MANGAAKVAISMPKEIFRSVEKTRRKLKMARSEAVVEALRVWLKELEEKELIRQYVEGYRRHPERISPQEVKARLKMAAEVFRKEAPWE